MDRRRVKRQAAVGARAVILGGALMVAGVAGCLVNEDERCPETYVFVAGLGACGCPANAIISNGLCKACGANEEASGKECRCKPGTARNATGICEVVTAGPGGVCASAAGCSDPSNAHCQLPAGQSTGYCTSTGCSSHAACAAGWSCATWEATPYCRRPPTGLGKTCATAADCAGLDASHCESFQSKSCVVAGCMLSPDNCGVGMECCDLAKLGLPLTMCVATGKCPTKAP